MEENRGPNEPQQPTRLKAKTPDEQFEEQIHLVQITYPWVTDTVLAQIKELGGTKAATSQAIAKLDEQYLAMKSEYDGLVGRLKELEVSESRIGKFEGNPETKAPESFSEMLIKSGIHKDITEKKLNQTGQFETPHFLSKALHPLAEVTASRFYDGIEGGDMQRYRPLSNFTTITEMTEPLRIESLLKVLPTTFDTVQYAETAGFDNLRGVVIEPAIIGATVLFLRLSEGFFVNQAIETVTGGRHQSDQTRTSNRVVGVDYDAGSLTLETPLAAAMPRGSAVVAKTFAGQIEGHLKPLAGLQHPKLRQEPVKTLPHAIVVPRQMLDDLPRLRAQIDMELLDGLDSNREFQILYGNGDERNLNGLLNNPGRQFYRQSDHLDSNGRPQSKIDAIRRASNLGYVAFMPVTTVIMNPWDWTDIELLKDNDGRYLWVSVTEGGVQRLWRFVITVAQTFEPGRVLMGDFKRACTLHNRQQGRIRMTESHEDQFLRNMVTILAEERLALTVERPAALIDVTFDVVPTPPGA